MCMEDKEQLLLHLNKVVKEQFALESSWNENNKCKFGMICFYRNLSKPVGSNNLFIILAEFDA